MPIETEENRALLYIPGTEVSKAKAEGSLKLENYFKEQGIEVAIPNGVGSTNSIRETRGGSTNLIQRPLDKVAAGFRKFRGYTSKTHAVNHSRLTDATKKFKAENPGHLVLAGHSRGAAVGITGIITDLYNKALKAETDGNTEGFLAEYNKISILALDPVQGLDTNNQLGLGKASDVNTTSISEMLNKIQEVSKKPDLFDVTIVQARYDARSVMKTDQRWQDFMEANEGKKCDVYHAGFQHSAMIRGNPVDAMYPEGKNPRDLIKALIKQKFGLIPKENFHAIATDIHKIELRAIQNLKNKFTLYKSKERKALKTLTSRKGFKGVSRKVAVLGESLAKTLKNSDEPISGKRKVLAHHTTALDLDKLSKTSLPKDFVLPQKRIEHLKTSRKRQRSRGH